MLLLKPDSLDLGPASLTVFFLDVLLRPAGSRLVSVRSELIYGVLSSSFLRSSAVSVASGGCSGFGFILEGVFFSFFHPPTMWFSLAGLLFLSPTPPVPCGCCGGAAAGSGGFTFQPRRYADPPSCRQINWGGITEAGNSGNGWLFLGWNLKFLAGNFLLFLLHVLFFFFFSARAAFWRGCPDFSRNS